MKSAGITKNSSQEFFHKICVVGGGLTGAIMSLLLKNSNLFKSHEIGWIKPKIAASNDVRTTFYNKKSLELLESLGLLKHLNNKDYTFIKLDIQDLVIYFLRVMLTYRTSNPLVYYNQG